MTDILEFAIGLRTRSEANMREHWAVKAKRAKKQRQVSYLTTIDAMSCRDLPSMPWRITLTRCGKRYLDEDNNAGSLKHIQDGLCDAIGIDDGDRDHKWHYDQEISKMYFVRVKIETREHKETTDNNNQ